jgi:hypothetical protein
MNEGISASDAAQEDQVNAVVESLKHIFVCFLSDMMGFFWRG